MVQAKSLLSVSIHTQRLVLHPVSDRHKFEIYMTFDEEITRYMHPKPPEKLEDTLEFIKTVRADMEIGKCLNMVILDTVTQEFYGCAGLHNVDTRTPEFGIWIKKYAHGHGFGREAVDGLMTWANENLDYDWLVYPVDRRNAASRKIPEKFGGIIAGRYETVSLDGIWLDIVEYRILRSSLV